MAETLYVIWHKPTDLYYRGNGLLGSRESLATKFDTFLDAFEKAHKLGDGFFAVQIGFRERQVRTNVEKVNS